MSSKVEQISEIQSRDRVAFEAWVEDPSNRLRLDLPTSALRFLIPPEVFKHAHDPSKIRLLENINRRETTEFFVAEERDSPLSDLIDLQRFYYNHSLLKTEYGGKLPPSIDFFHWEQVDAVLAGLIGPNDFVFNSVYLDIYSHADLRVISYGDRPEMRRKGVGLSFYTKLREFAERTGFRFISGEVDQKSDHDSNYTFYTKKLRRKRLSRLPRHLRDLLRDNADYPNSRVYTVECLYPEDLNQVNS